jgi:hypothetical protein
MAQETQGPDAGEYLKRFIPDGVRQNIVDNTVDSYYSYTYKLTLSMLPFSFHQNPQVNLDLNVGKGGSGGARIIIAQTGVTKFQIDNLQISSVVSKTAPKNLRGNRIYPFVLSFSLLEPFGMSFIDLLNRTMYELNKDLNLAKNPPIQQMPLLLEIELIGQKDNFENSSESAELGEVFYHNAYPIRLIDFEMDGAKQGTTYEVRCVPIHNFAPVADTTVETAPEELTISGSTVNELLADFSKQMKDKQQSIQTQKSESSDNKKPSFDIGVYKLASHGMPGLKDIFEVLKIDDDYTGNLDIKKIKPNTNESTISQVKEKDQSGQADTGNDGNSGKTITVNIPKNTKVEDVMISLASLNSDFCKHCGRYDVAPESSEFDPKTLNEDKTQYLVPDVYVTTEWDGKSFKSDNKLALTYTYNLTGKLDSAIVIDPAELNIEDNKYNDKITKAAQDRDVSKFYAYTYTGLNDQIIDVDLKQEYGVRYLFPGKGGKQSNYTLSPAAAPSNKAIDKTDKKEAGDNPATEKEILDKFAKIATELKSTITSLAMLPITITQDLAALAKGNKPDGISSKVGKVRMVNARLPSSPVAVLQKLESVTNLTDEVSTLTNSITELQEKIQGAISETIDEQISKIMSKAFTPFDVIDSKLSAIGAGINDFIDKIESTTGDLGIDQFGINTNALLDEAKKATDKYTSDAVDTNTDSTPPGFNPGGSTVTQSVSTIENTYMEEFEFDNNSYMIDVDPSTFQPKPLGVADTSYSGVLNRETGLVGPASKFANRSIFSTMLSNSTVGAPYMVKTSLEIKGDPYWLGMPIDSIKNKQYTMTQGKQFLGDLENDIGAVRNTAKETNTAPYGIGEVSFFFAYLFPREYDMWSDDQNTHTGEITDLSMNKSFSGQFQVYQVQHQFAGGKFTQTLNALKQVYKGQLPIVELRKEKAEEIAEEKAEENTEKIENNPVAIATDVNASLSNLLENRFEGLGTPNGIIPGTGVRGVRPSNTGGQAGGGNNPAFDPGT